MTHERYATPNHPRWDNRTDRTGKAPTEATDKTPTNRTPAEPSERRYGRRHRRGRRRNRRLEGTRRPDPSALLSRGGSDDGPSVELADESDWLRITVELSDLSLDDVRVSSVATGVRIRADAEGDSSRTEAFDRTVALTESVDTAGMAVTYCDPALTVLVPKSQPS